MFPISHHPGLLVLPLSGAGVKRRLELAHDFSFDLRAADESVKASGSYGISRKSCSLHLFITETIRQEQGCHWLWKKCQNGDTLGPVELIARPEQGNQGDHGDQGDWREQDGQVEVSIIIFGMSESYDKTCPTERSNRYISYMVILWQIRGWCMGVADVSRWGSGNWQHYCSHVKSTSSDESSNYEIAFCCCSILQLFELGQELSQPIWPTNGPPPHIYIENLIQHLSQLLDKIEWFCKKWKSSESNFVTHAAC